MADLVAQQFGNYHLIRLLGQGGFADVYLGEHIHLNTLAAVKVLRAQLVEDDITNFRTEARTIAHLKHPNIVQVLDFGVEGMTPYLIMQYAPNGTLRQRHPRGVPLALNVVVSYVKQMASALQYAHNQKLIHRDIKPENMLVDERNQVLLSDFGIAVVTASARPASALASVSWNPTGTVSYMAPEQIQGKMLPSSDQYALAIVAYEWLTGVLPFNGSYMEVVSQQISATPASLREKVPSLSPDVEQVVLTALDKDPQRRFGHIEAFANALEQTVQSVPVAVIVADPRKTSEVSRMEAVLISSLGRTVIGPTKVTIGRAPDNMIVLSDSRVSSHHAEIRPEGQYYSLFDLGSMNGTFVNEQQVSSGAQRLLQSGDAVRIGDTKFTFEVSSAPRGSSDGSTVRATPPPPLGNAGATPNFAGNTSYGMGNVNYGNQPSYQETIPAQSSSLTPPRSPYPQPPPSYMPPQSPYASETQMPTYIPSSYGQSGQQPSFTPQPPPNYTPPPSSTLPQSYTPPVYTPQPPQQQKRSLVRAIVLAVIALVIILGAAGSFFVVRNNQIATANTNATATANSKATVASSNVTATANSNATATAVPILTATAQATSPYPSFSALAISDPLKSNTRSQWDEDAECSFASGSYQDSLSEQGHLHVCFAKSSSAFFGDFAYQVNMTIMKGECGGLAFRGSDRSNFYIFEVCQDGTYDLFVFINGTISTVQDSHHSSAIHTGLNQSNLLAVAVQNNSISMYVNDRNSPISTVQGNSNASGQGHIGVLADSVNSPTVVAYTSAFVWTQ